MDAELGQATHTVFITPRIRTGNVMLDTSLIPNLSIAMVWDTLSHMRHYIKASAPSRMINVSSCANSQLLPKEGIVFDNLNGEKDGYIDVMVANTHPGNSMFISGLLRTSSVAAACWDARWSTRNYRLLVREAMTLKDLETSASTGALCSVSNDIVSSIVITPSILI
ncbi:hypothetical protein INT48_000521 [Thamnidium elegans]|uniref:Uncharacterized protein n=1 Tax=Thamnidium elegans TaxID=101142 RepID=A0A8H7SUY3_9FUNG|nr:hypothetical protein INT48_000521 [Thamnidium elegans]